eukprot:1149653-Pelagomonas_calceolata.AAC.6
MELHWLDAIAKEAIKSLSVAFGIPPGPRKAASAPEAPAAEHKRGDQCNEQPTQSSRNAYGGCKKANGGAYGDYKSGSEASWILVGGARGLGVSDPLLVIVRDKILGSTLEGRTKARSVQTSSAQLASAMSQSTACHLFACASKCSSSSLFVQPVEAVALAHY